MTHRTTLLLLLRFALPAGIALMLLLTLQTVTRSSSESMTSYGFPLAWHAPSAASSMAFDIAWGPLAIDALLHVLACHGIARLARRPLAGGMGVAVSLLLWLLALACIAFTALAIGTDAHLSTWTLDSYFSPGAQRSRSLHWGPGRWQ